MSLPSSETSVKYRRELRPISKRDSGRIWVQGKPYWDLSSNDYLGLSQEPSLIKALSDVTVWGSTGSRLLSGDYEIFHRLEERLASYLGRPSALLFNSGYQANVGILSSLLSKGDTVFADRLCHASLLDGVRLSGAKLVRFRHNDMGHLRRLLTAYGRALIITESVFSMDGDFAPLDDLVALKEEFGCKLMVDEAHAFGVFGPGLTFGKDVDVVVATFGKALGSYGAFVACSEALREHFIQSARSFIYSTALPPAVAAWNLAAVDLLPSLDERRVALKKCWEILGGQSPIVPVFMGESQAAIEKAATLRENGFWVLPICPPTVPVGKARLRLSLTWHHSDVLVEELASQL